MFDLFRTRLISEPAVTGPTRDGQQAAQLSVFAFLLAVGILLHQTLTDWTFVSHSSVVALAAIWVLARPSSLVRFLTLVAAQLAAFAVEIPFVVNHWMLLAIMGVSMLLCAAVAVRPGQGSVANRAAFYRAAAPVLRGQVLLMYLFATLAKINTDFFNADYSCAVGICRDLPFLTYQSWMALPVIWGTLIIEAGLPFLLLFRSTRVAALFAGIAFHVVLALDGFVPFSGLVMAFYWLFTPDDMPERLARVRADHPRLDAWALRAAAWGRSGWTTACLAAVGFVVGAAFEYRWFPGSLATLRYNTMLPLFVGYAAFVAWIFFRCVREGGPVGYRPGLVRLNHPVLVVAPLLVTLNGLCPYLGLKTHSSFGMFSNLRTEGDYWNHSFLPQSMRVFSFQDELVEIVSSSDEHLAKSAARGFEWVYFEFRNYISRHPDLAVTFRHAGEQITIDRVGDDPFFSISPGKLLSRIFWFRTVRPPLAGWCPS